MRSASEFNTVQRLIDSGMNDCATARQTVTSPSHDLRMASPATANPYPR